MSDPTAIASESLYPWLDAPWQSLSQRCADDRLPHALLLEGPVGIGKRRLADRLAARLLCETPSQSGGCGVCRGCLLRAAGTHPDHRIIGAEGERRPSIRIDAIRDLVSWLRLSSHYAGYRVALIDPADRMNVNAANSLLKTLEEPATGTVLILVASRPSRLPATVRSRCQSIRVAAPSRTAAEQWLQSHSPEAIPLLSLAGGAPPLAAELHEAGFGTARSELIEQLGALREGRMTPVAAAAAWQPGAVSERLLPLWQAVTAEALKAAMAAQGNAGRALSRAVAGLDSREVFRFQDRLHETMRAIEQPLQETLVAEGLFAEWSALGRGR